MLLFPSRVLAVSVAFVLLTGFRMPAKEDAAEQMLYDVRGAFVTAQPDVSPDLIAWTDSLVDAAIQATTRTFMLPRTILTVRIGEAKRKPMLLGARYSATVTVKAISVGSGEPIAEGAFEMSVLRFGDEGADKVLAGKIADRIASEFHLKDPRRSVVLTALSDNLRH